MVIEYTIEKVICLSTSYIGNIIRFFICKTAFRPPYFSHYAVLGTIVSIFIRFFIFQREVIYQLILIY